MTDQQKNYQQWAECYTDELTYDEVQRAKELVEAENQMRRDIEICKRYKQSQAFDADKYKIKDGKLTTKDTINPSYYVNMVIAPSDYIHANKIPYFEGNVIKYISRHRNKNGAEDIKKAIKYCEMILEKEYNDNNR